jgi:sporulation inhibitor KapD
MNRDFYVVDFEFTQCRQRERPAGFFSEIVEIGAVKIDGETLEVIGQDHHFVKPHFYPKQLKEIADFCMITDKEMQAAITFPEMVEGIKGLYVPKKTYFVAWGTEDYRVLNRGCERHGIDNPVLYDDYLDFAEWYKWEMGDSNTTGLRKATEEQCIDTGMLWHAAKDDAANTGKLLVQLLRDGWNPEDFMTA